MQHPINLLLVDDHQMMLDGFTSMLSTHENLNLVTTATNGYDALKALEIHPEINIAVLDFSMEQMNGLELAAEIKSRFPRVKSILTTFKKDERFALEVLESPVLGYVLKVDDTHELMRAIEKVYLGKEYYSSTVKDIMISALRRKDKKPAEMESKGQLTRREKEVLSEIAKGKSTKDIAELLFISENTVETHRRNMRKKLGFKRSTELVGYAITNNLVNFRQSQNLRTA